MELSIPRRSLVLLCGPAGAGKSTFASRIFNPTQIVSSDRCRALLVDDEADQSVNRMAFELMHYIVEGRLMLGRTTVADATNLRPEHRRPFLEMARGRNFRAVVLVFNTSLAECMDRNAGRGRVVPQEALEHQHRLLQATLTTIGTEGFDEVHIMTESEEVTALPES